MSDEKEPSASADSAAKGNKKAKPAKDGKEKAAKKGIPWVLLLIPIALIAAAVLAYTLPPTHALLVKSPLGPLIARFDHTPAKTLAAGAAPTSDPVADVKRLNDTVETDKKSALAKDAQIAQLQAQVAKDAAPPSPTPAPKSTPNGASDDVRRTATYWAGMDPDKAADIIGQLPESYVKVVLAQMPADAVSDILSALPAKTAARLTADTGPSPP